ncbi:MAG: glycerol-3-phosphate acyltransferase [Coriobacteriia bacterium]|nr:glycerol-3-phosphate acyltransferase [Coriobacteriia bacterium]
MAFVAFLSGSLPFSVWLGRLIARRDVRQFGDGNPGAMNVLRMGNPTVGIVVLLLDVTKGVLPVVFARQALGYGGWMLALIAVLPVAGHAFSPFLRFRGGKALAVTLGTWIGLTYWRIPLIAVVVVVVATWLIRRDAWAVVVALAAMALGIVFWLPDWSLGLVLLSQAAIILWKHRAELVRRPELRQSGTQPR